MEITVDGRAETPETFAALVHLVAFVVWLTEPAGAWTRRDWLLAHSVGVIFRQRGGAL